MVTTSLRNRELNMNAMPQKQYSPYGFSNALSNVSRPTTCSSTVTVCRSNLSSLGSNSFGEKREPNMIATPMQHSKYGFFQVGSNVSSPSTCCSTMTVSRSNLSSLGSDAFDEMRNGYINGDEKGDLVELQYEEDEDSRQAESKMIEDVIRRKATYLKRISSSIDIDPSTSIDKEWQYSQDATSPRLIQSKIGGYGRLDEKSVTSFKSTTNKDRHVCTEEILDDVCLHPLLPFGLSFLLCFAWT